MLSEAVQLELAKSVPLFVAALPGMLAAFFAYKAHATAQQTQAIAKQTEVNTNHMKDELVNEVRQAAFAAGKKQQQEEK